MIDVDKLKATKSWRDITFWAALLSSWAMALPLMQQAWQTGTLDATAIGAAFAPFTGWLLGNGYLRGSSVTAAGAVAAAGAAGVETAETYDGEWEPMTEELLAADMEAGADG